MDKSREQFEAWFEKEFDSKMDEYGEVVVNLVKREQFKVWQASRESLEVELPDKYTLEYMQDDLSDSECDFFKCDDIKNELLNNGVKIK